jgi:hypothetical protein
MAQPMPVVRQMKWSALIPQFVPIALFALALHSTPLQLDWPGSILIGGIVYWIICRILRRIFVRDFIAGMKAYRARNFEQAIAHFSATYDFFLKHRRLDSFRSLLFGVAGPNPYRILAQCNIAYCHTQLGRGTTAIEFYEKALAESPECTLAQTSLTALRSMQNAEVQPIFGPVGFLFWVS